MALLTKNTGSGTDFAPAPEGDFQGVVVDVKDLGYIEKTFQGQSQGLKPQVSLVYQIGGLDEDGNEIAREDGKPYLVFGRRYVLSMNERAGFYKEVCGILGKKRVDEALESGTLDTEDLVGKNVNLVIVHNEASNGQNYANIESLKPWNPRHGDLIQPRDYERAHLRDSYVPPEFSAFGDPPPSSARASLPKDNVQVAPRPAPRNEPDPRAKNGGESQKGVAKRLASGDLGERLPRPATVPSLPEDGDFVDPFELE